MLEQVGVERVPVPDAAGLALADVELADRQGHQVGGHRLLRAPRPGRPAVAGLLALQDPVGDGLQTLRDGGGDAHRGGVPRVVVGGEPGRRGVGLAGDDRAVVGVDEAGDAEEGVPERLRHAVVGDDGGERGAVGQHVLRSDGQLLPAPAPGRVVAVDGERPDLQPHEVEIEAGQVLEGPRLDGGDPGEDVGGRVVTHVEVVVPDVVAAVAVEREVRVPDAGCTGRSHRVRRRPRGRWPGRRGAVS